MKTLRAERRIPSHAIEITAPCSKASYCYVSFKWFDEKSNFFVVRSFKGSSLKHRTFYAYRNEAQADDAIESTMKYQRAEIARYEEQQAKVKNYVRDLEVDDILCASWGWEQTNITWYQVTKLVGKKSVEIREIHGKKTYDHDMSGTCLPIKDDFVNDKVIKKVATIYGVKVNSYETAQKWDGTSAYFSCYA